MEYASVIFLGWWFAHYKPAYHWAASKLFEPSPKMLKKDVLTKDEAESKKPNWLLMVL